MIHSKSWSYWRLSISPCFLSSVEAPCCFQSLLYFLPAVIFFSFRCHTGNCLLNSSNCSVQSWLQRYYAYPLLQVAFLLCSAYLIILWTFASDFLWFLKFSCGRAGLHDFSGYFWCFRWVWWWSWRRLNRWPCSYCAVVVVGWRGVAGNCSCRVLRTGYCLQRPLWRYSSDATLF